MNNNQAIGYDQENSRSLHSVLSLTLGILIILLFFWGLVATPKGDVISIERCFVAFIETSDKNTGRLSGDHS